MQIDFHHTAIYVLCRLAGMKSIYAEKVAYASQQVDNANYAHALKFENGGIFHQTRTAHENLAFLKMADVNDAFNIWLPFHFIPSGEGGDMLEALITRPHSCTIALLKEEVIAAGDQGHALHLLGIFLHIYADAFSHQDFKGFYDPYNHVKVTRSLERMTFKNRLIFEVVKRLPAIFPVGHALAAKNPDIPCAVWSYQRAGLVEERVDNLYDRFIPAVINIFDFLVDYLEENNQFGQPINSELQEKDLDIISRLLSFRGSCELRHQIWLDNLKENCFNFVDFDEVDKNLSYEKRNWFKEAVLARQETGFKRRLEYKAFNYHSFQKRDSFDRSDWTLFMRAAAIHKYKLLHEILPTCGLYIG